MRPHSPSEPVPARTKPSWALLVNVLLAAAVLSAAVPLALGANAGRVTLYVSADASRQPASRLAGARVTTDVYLFATATRATEVRFWLDTDTNGPADSVQSLGGSSAPKGYPFDFMGTAGERPGVLALEDLRPGSHTLTALALFAGGQSRSTTATFTVAAPQQSQQETSGGGGSASNSGADSQASPSPTPSSSTEADSTGAGGRCSGGEMPEPLHGYPDAGTTGVPGDLPLTRIDGDYRTKKDGEIISGVEITGRLYVDHDNVTVVCSRIWRSTITTQSNLRMWLSTLGDPNGVAEGAAVKRSDYTLRRVEILGTIDGLRAEGNVDVRDSWIHDLYRTEDPAQENGMTHNDSVQTTKGSHMVFINNRFDTWSFTDGETAGAHTGKTPYGDGSGYQTSAFMINSGSGDISDILIQNNLIRGRASKYIFALSKAPYVTTGVRIIDNVMGVENRDYPQWFAIRSDAVMSGNVAVAP